MLLSFDVLGEISIYTDYFTLNEFILCSKEVYNRLTQENMYEQRLRVLPFETYFKIQPFRLTYKHHHTYFQIPISLKGNRITKAFKLDDADYIKFACKNSVCNVFKHVYHEWSKEANKLKIGCFLFSQYKEYGNMDFCDFSLFLDDYNSITVGRRIIGAINKDPSLLPLLDVIKEGNLYEIMFERVYDKKEKSKIQI